jgi:ADP-ribose pyrophosphatase YjhB (NUDIX family)
MRRLLARVWRLPWPRPIRRLLGDVATLGWLQRVIIPQFLVGVVGIIENERGEVLLLRHTYRGDYPWGLPTGFLEHREQPRDALRREVKEEIGYQVDVGDVWRVVVDERRPLLSIVFRGRYREGDFAASPEVSAARFFSPADLPPLLPEQRQLIHLAFEMEVTH